MIIPDNLTPFPVMPATREPEQAKPQAEDDFVSERTIRHLLIGPMVVAPMATSKVPADQGFAGRDDVDEDKALPFVVLSSDEAYQEEPVIKLQPEGPHPAMAEPKPTAARLPRILGSRRSDRRRASDRWWVLGMGVALMAVIASGAMIELVTDAAFRHVQRASEAEQLESPALPEPKLDGENASLAASNPEYPAP